MPEFVWALSECCESPVEMKLLLHIMRLANERDLGNPGGWIQPILPGDAAELAGCSTQNLRCEGKRLFGEWSLIERMEAPEAVGKKLIAGPVDPRAHTYRVRIDPTDPAAIDRFLKARREAKRKAQEEAERAAAAAEPEVEEEEEKPAARRTSLLLKPVKIGPKAPLQLSPESRELIRKCTSIGSSRTGELKRLVIEDGNVLIFDFAPATVGASPKTEGRRKSISASVLADLPNDLLKTKELAVSPVRANGALERLLRDELDRKLMAKCGESPIDDAIFGRVLTELGTLDDRLVAGMMALVQASYRKIFSWAFLVTAPGSKVLGLAARARVAYQREKELMERTPPTPEQKATTCKRCGGSGLVGTDWESIPDAVRAVQGGAAYCSCSDAAIVRDLVAPALLRRSS